MIGPFEFQLHEEQVSTPDYTFCEITYKDISVPFQIVAIDTSIECGPHSCLNFVEFIWNNLGVFIFKMYAIVAVSFDKPGLLYLLYLVKAEQQISYAIIALKNLNKYSHRLSAIVPFNVPADVIYLCLRQPPTLKGLASYTVFHFTFNVDQFRLTSRMPYKQHQHAEHSNVINQKLIPHTFPLLKCDFVRQRNCGDKRFHNECVM